MRLVIDASVAIKWFTRSSADEPDLDMAINILRGIDDDRVQLIQPPHFFAEIAAVLARLTPLNARSNLEDLWRMNWEIEDSPSVYLLGVELAKRLQHHLFDTLYHATAIHTQASALVTADERYYAKAKAEGRIQRLEEFSFA